MSGSEVCRMPNNYCPECDKDFKSLTGLNGHNQWKHNKVPEHLVSNSPTGKTNEMLEQLSEQIEDLQKEVRILRTGNNGNGNGNSQQKYACQNCWDEGKHQLLSPNAEECPSCQTDLQWDVALI